MLHNENRLILCLSLNIDHLFLHLHSFQGGQRSYMKRGTLPLCSPVSISMIQAR